MPCTQLKTTQNQLIECIGEHIRDKIFSEVREAKWYTILCDEVTDVSSQEQLSIVLRFVDTVNFLAYCTQFGIKAALKCLKYTGQSMHTCCRTMIKTRLRNRQSWSHITNR